MSSRIGKSARIRSGYPGAYASLDRGSRDRCHHHNRRDRRDRARRHTGSAWRRSRTRPFRALASSFAGSASGASARRPSSRVPAPACARHLYLRAPRLDGRSQGRLGPDPGPPARRPLPACNFVELMPRLRGRNRRTALRSGPVPPKRLGPLFDLMRPTTITKIAGSQPIGAIMPPCPAS